jgi:hypothetical protein
MRPAWRIAVGAPIVNLALTDVHIYIPGSLPGSCTWKSGLGPAFIQGANALVQKQ